MTQPTIRKASSQNDVDAIFYLLETFSHRKLLLARNKTEILKHLDSFIVAELNDCILGCACLRPYDETLFEVRSLAVDETHQGNRIGSLLVYALIEKLKTIPHARLFALTYRANFFRQLGFRLVAKSCFPEKIWSDCVNCPKQHCCDEDAVLYQI